MSGGRLDYFYSRLEEHVGDFEDKELDDLVEDLSRLFHDREWYLSGDTGAGNWNEARDAFKKKWFTEHGRQDRIERYLSDLSDEFRRSFGISNKYCKNCKHWSVETVEDGLYGICAFKPICLTHRNECCDEWEDGGSDLIDGKLVVNGDGS